MSIKIIFNEIIINELGIQKNIYHSIAANNWSRNFSKSIYNIYFNFLNVGFIKSRIFPYGPLFCTASGKYLNNELPQVPLSYINLPILRSISQYWQLSKSIKPFYNEDVFLVTYNIPSYVDRIVSDVKNFKYKWVPIILDYDNIDQNQTGLNETLCHACGVVTVSKYAFNIISHSRKLHLDGGVDTSIVNKYRSDINTKPSEKYILYTGMLDAWGGVDAIIEIFKNHNINNLKLYIAGHGKLRSEINSDNIVFFGKVSESDLHNLCLNAYCFINPRPENMDGNQMNFPSKIFKYLEYGKPIISTKTQGISDDYDDILNYYNSFDLSTFFNALNDVDHIYQNNQQLEFFDRVMNFIKNKRSWNSQALRFLDWLKSISA